MLKEEVVSYIKEYHMNIEDVNELIGNAVNENGIEELLEFIAGEDYVRNLAVGLANYSFRSGPVELMHSGIDPKDADENTEPHLISQLSDEDMKLLNKYMVDKLGFIIHMLLQKRYVEVADILSFYISIGGRWDSPNIEKEEAEYKKYISKVKQRSLQ